LEEYITFCAVFLQEYINSQTGKIVAVP